MTLICPGGGLRHLHFICPDGGLTYWGADAHIVLGWHLPLCGVAGFIRSSPSRRRLFTLQELMITSSSCSILWLISGMWHLAPISLRSLLVCEYCACVCRGIDNHFVPPSAPSDLSLFVSVLCEQSCRIAIRIFGCGNSPGMNCHRRIRRNY